jgi:hypothetical protein
MIAALLGGALGGVVVVGLYAIGYALGDVLAAIADKLGRL